MLKSDFGPGLLAGLFLEVFMMMDAIVSCYIDMIEFCIPFCAVFGFGNMAVSSILRAAFGGRLIIR